MPKTFKIHGCDVEMLDIAEFARELGVTTKTIRRWEGERHGGYFGLPMALYRTGSEYGPARKGARLYSRRQVSRVLALKESLGVEFRRGFQISEATREKWLAGLVGIWAEERRWIEDARRGEEAGS